MKNFQYFGVAFRIIARHMVPTVTYAADVNVTIFWLYRSYIHIQIFFLNWDFLNMLQVATYIAGSNSCFGRMLNFFKGIITDLHDIFKVRIKRNLQNIIKKFSSKIMSFLNQNLETEKSIFLISNFKFFFRVSSTMLMLLISLE